MSHVRWQRGWRGEAATLVFLVASAAFAFIPAWRTIELGGMAVFGWLIAALMLVSPAMALFTFSRRRGDDRGRDGVVGNGSGTDGIGIDGGEAG